MRLQWTSHHFYPYPENWLLHCVTELRWLLEMVLGAHVPWNFKGWDISVWQVRPTNTIQWPMVWSGSTSEGEPPPLLDHFEMCHKQLIILLKELRQNPEILSEFDFIVRDHLSKWVGEVVAEPSLTVSNRMHYLPYHGVVQENKAILKLWIVCFTAAIMTGLSLNYYRYVHVDPEFGQSIFEILLHFCLHRVTFLEASKRLSWSYLYKKEMLIYWDSFRLVTPMIRRLICSGNAQSIFLPLLAQCHYHPPHGGSLRSGSLLWGEVPALHLCW